MNLEPLVVGSIKDRVVCSVWALGELATRGNLSKAVECNGALLAISIEALERDGYMRKVEGGWYVLDEHLAATLKPADRASIAKSHPVNPTAAGATMATIEMKECKGKCGKEKSVNDFYPGCAKCKRCTLDGRRNLSRERRARIRRRIAEAASLQLEQSSRRSPTIS